MEDVVFTLYFMFAALLCIGLLESLRRIWRRIAKELTKR